MCWRVGSSRRRNRRTGLSSCGPAQARRDLGEIVLVQVIDHAAGVFEDEIGAQRPGRIGVAEHRDEVRHVGIHRAFVGVASCRYRPCGRRRRLRRRRAFAARGPVAATMMSASSSWPDFSLIPFSVNVVDVIGDDRGLAAADRFEHVVVGHEAEPLLPRLVGRREVLLDRLLRKLLFDALHQALLERFRPIAREAEEELLEEGADAAVDVVGHLRREAAAAVLPSASTAGSEIM